MPFFKKKDKLPQSLEIPTESRPELREEGSHSTFNTAPRNTDTDSNLSSADTRVNQQRDANGNRQTVVTTTTTTTTTTVTSDGRVITEQHDHSPSELPANPSPRPRSPDHQAQQIPVQSSTTATSVPSIPNRDARRSSEHARRASRDSLTSANMLQPPPPMPYQQTSQQSAQQNNQHSYPQSTLQSTQQSNTQPSQPTTTPTSPNFSRPGGRREKAMAAGKGIFGASESLRGAFNTKAGELLGDDAETLAKNREVRDKGMADVRGSSVLRKVVR